MDSVKFSISSILIALILLSTSPYWLPKSKNVVQDLVYDVRSPEKEEKEWNTSTPLTLKQSKGQEHKTCRDQYYRLIRENKRLRRELAQMELYRKNIANDLKFLSVEIVGDFFRQKKDIWMINAGKDLGLRKGDLLVQEDSVIGQLVDVAESCSLVENMTAQGTQHFVKIDSIAEEALLEGEGKLQAAIHVEDQKLKNIINRRVYLNRSFTLGGHFIIGNVSSVDKQRNGNQLIIGIKGREVDPNKPLFIAQETELKDITLFKQRNRLAQLKSEIEELERLKLKLEIIRK